MNDPSAPDSKPAHTLQDHLHGEAYDRSHEGEEGADHDHDSFDDEGNLEDNPIWIADHVSLKSVGIDIGSSGTQVLFSRLDLRRLGEDLSSRYFVVSRETLFQSPVSLTPYQSDELIDEQALGKIIDDAYDAARIHPDDIDTGVVILTGEALRRENAQAIASVLAEQGGEFVCASAGHHMEAMLAAYGSGAARVSHDRGERILNVDIGGGTTKLALVDRGNVIATAALHIGGRLQVVDDEMRIVRLDPAGRYLALNAGHEWQRGDVASDSALDGVAQWMADALIAVLKDEPLPRAVDALYLTEPLPPLGPLTQQPAGQLTGQSTDGLTGQLRDQRTPPLAGVMFSGGVGEYVYDRERRDFGDLGRRFGHALKRRIDEGALPWPLLPAGECIRATALGASEYSVQLSGNTTYISNPGTLLPRRNLQVLQPPYEAGESIDPNALARAIGHHFKAFDFEEGKTDVALAFRWQGAPSFERIAAFARGVALALPRTIEAGKPLFIILDGDVAQTLGAILREEENIASDILVLDGVTLWDFDYIDLGRIRMPSLTVPVTVKSLVFSRDPRLPDVVASTGPSYVAHEPHDHAHAESHAHTHSHPHEHHQGQHHHGAVIGHRARRSGTKDQ